MYCANLFGTQYLHINRITMSINWPQSGEYYVPAYQVSALPYVTSSVITNGQVHEYEFQTVTKFMNVANRGVVATDKIALAFTRNGFNTGNFITLDAGDTVHEEIRTTRMYVSCSSGISVGYQVFCGLTNIPARNFLTLTGSHGHTGVG